ncbi:MAG: HAMP domain-containing histidine kinase [Spirochaetales bacterium]|nr:HAMP domain-containing histidine kinase [Spirochaetales bacterium]
MNHVAMAAGIFGLAAYSVIEYFILPGHWGEFFIFRAILIILGLGLMGFSMFRKKGSQVVFYVFWIPMYFFGAYAASRIGKVPDLLAWNVHLCIYVLFIASIAVSPLHLTWILTVTAAAAYVLAFLVRPAIPFHVMVVNGGIHYLTSLFLFPLIMFVRYRLYEQNVTLRARIEDQNDELRRANESKDRFFSLLAHDLKGPIGSSKRVLDRIIDGDLSDAGEHLRAVGDAVNRSYSILENLLWWSRSQRGELSVLPVEISVENLVEKAWREVATGAERKRVVLETAIDRSDFVVADKKLAHTIVLNLLSNAVKYSNPGGRVTVSAEKSNNRLVIEVRDTGAGMDGDKITKLFRIDEKQSEATDTGERGSGLGLIVSKVFAEKNGGTLNVKSEPGKGSSFYLELPSA